jgi:hypothetical protein
MGTEQVEVLHASRESNYETYRWVRNFVHKLQLIIQVSTFPSKVEISSQESQVHRITRNTSLVTSGQCHDTSRWFTGKTVLVLGWRALFRVSIHCGGPAHTETLAFSASQQRPSCRASSYDAGSGNSHCQSFCWDHVRTLTHSSWADTVSR